MPAELQTETRGTTLVLSLRDPGSSPLLSEQVFTAGVEALNVAESNPELRCVVLRGEGAHFCADARLPARSADQAAAAQIKRHFQSFAEALRVFPKPVLAAIEGMACGDGFWLAMACDLVVSASDASFLPFPTRLGLEEPGDGRFPSELLRQLSRGQRLQWMWQDQPLSASHLLALGWVQRVTGGGQALEAALQWAQQLAQRPASELALAKECVNQPRG